MKTWVYWQGKMPPIYELCIETIKRHNQDVEVLDERSLSDMGGAHVLEATRHAPIASRADLVRLWLLKEFGGQWVDSDCICLRPLPFEQDLDEWEFCCWSNKPQTPYISNSVMASRPGGKIVTEAYEQCLKYFQTTKKPIWGASGQAILKPLVAEYPKTVRLYERWKFAKVYWQDVARFKMREQNEIRFHSYNVWNPASFLYHLTNRPTHWFRKYDREQILTHPSFLGFLMRKALGFVRPLRARALLDRLPMGVPLRGAELGILRGTTSQVLLQQRPQLHLVMVDLWEKLRLGKYVHDLERFSRGRLIDHRKSAVKGTEFAKDRRTILQMDTVAAADRIPDGSLDFVFIDGDHTYEGCRGDIVAWLPKLKPDGIIGGHDWGKRPWTWGVTKAVEETSREINRDISLDMETTWFIHLGDRDDVTKNQREREVLAG